jgi:hypothetical protein
MFLGVVLRGSAVGAVAGALVTTAILLTGPDASAKSSFDSAYGFDRTWNAALRMVRVDMNLKITEKDEQSGYLLFEYKSQESQKPSSGSMEFIRGRDADSPVHVVVQLPQMPKYHEQVLVDDLARKLRNEYGEAPRRKPTPAPIDAGADGS